MSKNLIPQIAQMLGLELGEEFKIKGYDDSNTRTYKFTAQGLRVKLVEHPEATEFNALVAFHSLLVGDAEIVKLPWKPKAGEQYCSFGNRYIGDASIWIIVDVIWDGSAYDIAMLGKGWVYRNKKEAAAALPKVAAEMGVDYEL